jgi:hypothetical protein
MFLNNARPVTRYLWWANLQAIMNASATHAIKNKPEDPAIPRHRGSSIKSKIMEHALPGTTWGPPDPTALGIMLEQTMEQPENWDSDWEHDYDDESDREGRDWGTPIWVDQVVANLS